MPGVSVPVSAALFRVVEVEQAMLRRGGEVSARTRRTLSPEGIDPHYSDSYVPVGVDYLSYPPDPGSATPQWRPLAE